MMVVDCAAAETFCIIQKAVSVTLLEKHTPTPTHIIHANLNRCDTTTAHIQYNKYSIIQTLQS